MIPRPTLVVRYVPDLGWIMTILVVGALILSIFGDLCRARTPTTSTSECASSCGGVPPAGPVSSCLGSGAVSRLLHPVGPEPVQTYWARRALMFGAAAMLAVAAALIIHS
ncbi:MAG TPA: hypothetical protein VI074_12680, partial [Propionibacteriaceae bacterium]